MGNAVIRSEVLGRNDTGRRKRMRGVRRPAAAFGILRRLWRPALVRRPVGGRRVRRELLHAVSRRVRRDGPAGLRPQGGHPAGCRQLPASRTYRTACALLRSGDFRQGRASSRQPSSRPARLPDRRMRLERDVDGADAHRRVGPYARRRGERLRLRHQPKAIEFRSRAPSPAAAVS